MCSNGHADGSGNLVEREREREREREKSCFTMIKTTGTFGSL